MLLQKKRLINTKILPWFFPLFEVQPASVAYRQKKNSEPPDIEEKMIFLRCPW